MPIRCLNSNGDVVLNCCMGSGGTPKLDVSNVSAFKLTSPLVLGNCDRSKRWLSGVPHIPHLQSGQQAGQWHCSSGFKLGNPCYCPLWMHFLQDLSGLGSIWFLTLTRITMCQTFSTPRNGLVPTGPRYDQFATSPGQERWWLIHTDWWCWQLRHWNSTGWHWDSHRWNWCPKIYRNPRDLTANMGFWGGVPQHFIAILGSKR